MNWNLVIAAYLGGAFATLVDGITTCISEKSAPAAVRNWPRMYFGMQLVLVFILTIIWPIDRVWDLIRATFGRSKQRRMEREIVEAALHVYNAMSLASNPPTREEAETLKLSVQELHATVH